MEDLSIPGILIIKVVMNIQVKNRKIILLLSFFLFENIKDDKIFIDEDSL